MKSFKLLLLSASVVSSLFVQTIFAGELSSQVVTLNRGSNTPSSIELQIPFDLRNSKTGEISHVMEKSVPTERLRTRRVWSGILIQHREKKYVWVKDYRDVEFDNIELKIKFENGTELTGQEMEQIEISLEGSDWSPRAKIHVLGDHEYEVTQYYDNRNTIFVHFGPKSSTYRGHIQRFFEFL